MSTISDVDLVAAIEHAYRDGYRRFLSLALGMLGDVDRARDAVQEAFAHALRHRGDLREAESLNAWLWQIMVNVCRAEKRHQVMGLDDSYEFEANGRPDDWLEVRAVIPPRRDRANGASPTADFEVRVVAPRRVRVLATGVEVRPGLWRADAVRDFTLALGSFQVKTTTIRAPDPVRVTVALERGSKFTMREYLPDAVKAFRSYVARYSGYPWPAHTLVVMPDMDRAGPNGFVWPMMSLVGGTNFDLIAHETAHQWFYSLVGVNTARDPWLIEGLATWAETGPERSLSTFLATPIPPAVRDRIGEPMSFWDRFGFETIWPGLYVQPVQALATLGEPDAVDCALRAYVVKNAYRTVRPRELLAHCLLPRRGGEAACLGCALLTRFDSPITRRI